MYEALISSHVR